MQVSTERYLIINDNWITQCYVLSLCGFLFLRLFMSVQNFHWLLTLLRWLCLLFQSSAFHWLYETNCKFLSASCPTVDSVQIFFLAGRHLPRHTFHTLASENLDRLLWGDNYWTQLMTGVLVPVKVHFPRKVCGLMSSGSLNVVHRYNGKTTKTCVATFHKLLFVPKK